MSRLLSCTSLKMPSQKLAEVCLLSDSKSSPLDKDGNYHTSDYGTVTLLPGITSPEGG